MTPRPWPTELVFRRASRSLAIAFDDGYVGEISFETLRVKSPSAEARGHGGGAAPIVGKEQVEVVEAHPVGRYAVRLVFDDGHATGIYSWDYLRALAAGA